MHSILTRFSKRFLPILLSVFLVLSSSAVMPFARAASLDNGFTFKIDPDNYYGRTMLSGLSNSTALLYAYDKIVEGIDNSLDEIDVYDGKNSLSYDEFSMVFDAYLSDHPEHFWIGYDYTYYFSDDESTILSISPCYTMSGNALIAARKAFQSAAADLLNGIDDSMPEFDRELYIHDCIAAHTEYEYASNALNAYGALVEGKAVCEGYAEAFQYLLQLAGLQAIMVSGTGTNSDGTTEDHAWNIVRIDGNYYHVDPTWDDSDDYLYHAYFNKTTAAIAEDHNIEVSYPLPACTSEDADYFTVYGGKMESFDADTLATLLDNPEQTACIYITGDVNAFARNLDANISDIANRFGLTSYSYSYSYLGREYQITISE